MGWSPHQESFDLVTVGARAEGVGGAGLAGDEVLSLTGLADGRYYVVVDGSAGSEGPFELVVSDASVPVVLMRFAIDGDQE